VQSSVGSQPARVRASAITKALTVIILLAGVGVPLSLIADFAWESTIGIDPVWSLPHVANYVTITLGGLAALGLVIRRSSPGFVNGISFGKLNAPLGVWVMIWALAVFVTAILFDRWWQSAYGLSAGIWHPPQILKAISFFALLLGVWLFCLNLQNHGDAEINSVSAKIFSLAGGLVLAMITVVTLTSVYPNYQHSAKFYKIACATYPLVLVALATAGKARWPATMAALSYTAVLCVTIWLLPLFPAKPLVAPIYNPLNHLMPPPFPLLLIFPAMGLDNLLRRFSWQETAARPWLQSVAAGTVFFVSFALAQWVFAEILLDDATDNWFFAGGGKHWPFFLKISPVAKTTFWETTQDPFNFTNALVALALAILAAGLGVWFGEWMKRVRR
jgi:hypothetical protein